MKHAGQEALDSVEDVLAAVRAHPELTERKRGAFYRKSAGFLHFHEDPAGMFADVKVGKSFERLPVNSPEERATLITRVTESLASP